MARPVKLPKRERVPQKYAPELVPVSSLKPHPKNYRSHPPDQLEHIRASIRQHGFYRNVVVARDLTILAGHGVAEATRLEGISEVPVVRLDLDPDDPRALKVLAGDNELGKFSENDDRALTELLRGIREGDELGLLGTGYDEKMLAALVMVTRPASEILDINEAAEWVGMPDYDAEGESQLRLVVAFSSTEDRQRFVEQVGLKIVKKERMTWSTRWPEAEREDAASVRFETA